MVSKIGDMIKSTKKSQHSHTYLSILRSELVPLVNNKKKIYVITFLAYNYKYQKFKCRYKKFHSPWNTEPNIDKSRQIRFFYDSVSRRFDILLCDTYAI